MSKRITQERIVTYMKYLGMIGVPVGIGLITLLFSLGSITVESHNNNEFCGGDITCWLELNQTCFKEDVFIYPMNGSLLVNARPTDTINSLKLFRSWGEGWREINLNQTCRGSWCGCSWCTTSNTAAFVYAFREDKCYNLRIEIEKDMNSTINWNINPEGVWYGYEDVYEVVERKICEHQERLGMNITELSYAMQNPVCSLQNITKQVGINMNGVYYPNNKILDPNHKVSWNTPCDNCLKCRSWEAERGFCEEVILK